jgi:flagellar hook protein FlgE
MRALSIAATGMLAQQTNVEVIANNLANMNTTGYKQQRAAFQDLLYQNIQQAGAQSSDTGTLLPSGIQLGAGVRTAAVYRVTTPGDLKNTSNPYDVAINGAGYFRVQMPDGTDAFTPTGDAARLCRAAWYRDPRKRDGCDHQLPRPGTGDDTWPDCNANGRSTGIDAVSQRRRP